MPPIDGSPEAVDALDRRWEARLDSGDTTGQVPSLDPGLTLTLDRLYALDDAPGVDPVFVRRLEERLMSSVRAAAQPTRRFRFIPFGDAPRLIWPARRTKASPGSRSFGAIVTGVALLLVVVAVGLVTMRLGDDDSGTSGLGVATAPMGTPSSGSVTESGPAIALVLADIAYYPTQLGIPPNTDVTLTIANVGQVRHSFNVDALGIHVELEPGAYQTITVNAPAGTYRIYCSVPGHESAGMVGTLHVDAAYRLPTSATAGSAIRPSPVSVQLVVDAIPLLNGDANATADAVEQLEEALTPFAEAGCRIGFVITEGQASDIGQGNAVADVVNDLIAREFPELAEGAGFYSLANLGGPPGPVTLRVFPNAGCPVSDPITTAPPRPTPSSAATQTPIATARLVLPTQTPFLTPTEEPTPLPTIEPGATVFVTADGVNLRSEPSYSSEPLRQMRNGEELLVIAGPIAADDAVWYQVEGADGVVGYVVADFIARTG